MDYLKLFQTHEEYEAFVSGGTMLRPNVSHCVSENDVHYNPGGILPENQELWEKFNQIYEDDVTSEDLQLFSTYPMDYFIENGTNDSTRYYHELIIHTDITSCFGSTSNPEYKQAYLSFEDNNETASIDDFIRDEYDGNARWQSAQCGK